jgi:hypothetical protein
MQITAMKSVLISSYLLFWGIVVVLTPGVLGNDSCTSGCNEITGITDMSLCTNDCLSYSENADMSSCTSNCQALGRNTNMSSCTSNCTTVGKDTDMSSCTKNCDCRAPDCDNSSCTENCKCVTGCVVSSNPNPDPNYKYGPKNYLEIGYIIAIVIGVLFLNGMHFYLQKKKRGKEEQSQKDENKPVFPVAAQQLRTQQQYAPVATQHKIDEFQHKLINVKQNKRKYQRSMSV